MYNDISSQFRTTCPVTSHPGNVNFQRNTTTNMLTTTLNPRPQRPTPRNRFIEFHEQPYVPAYIRRPIQDMLTLAWTNTFWPLQKQSPSELIVDVLEEQVRKLTRTGQAGGRLSVVDFCSGAGGPIRTIERIMKYVRLSSLSYSQSLPCVAHL